MEAWSRPAGAAQAVDHGHAGDDARPISGLGRLALLHARPCDGRSRACSRPAPDPAAPRTAPRCPSRSRDPTPRNRPRPASAVTVTRHTVPRSTTSPVFRLLDQPAAGGRRRARLRGRRHGGDGGSVAGRVGRIDTELIRGTAREATERRRRLRRRRRRGSSHDRARSPRHRCCRWRRPRTAWLLASVAVVATPAGFEGGLVARARRRREVRARAGGSDCLAASTASMPDLVGVSRSSDW